MKISIVSGFEAVITSVRGDKTYYEQQAYADLGQAYPVPFKMSLDSPNQCYQVGDYVLDPESFRVNQYGSLEINRFGLKLKKPVALTSAKAS